MFIHKPVEKQDLLGLIGRVVIRDDSRLRLCPVNPSAVGQLCGLERVGYLHGSVKELGFFGDRVELEQGRASYAAAIRLQHILAPPALCVTLSQAAIRAFLDLDCEQLLTKIPGVGYRLLLLLVVFRGKLGVRKEDINDLRVNPCRKLDGQSVRRSMFSVGRSEFVPCLPGPTSLPPVISPQVIQRQWFAQSTWGTRRACAGAAQSTHGADKEAQSQNVNVVSGVLTESCAIHMGPPPD
jgi:hypothetical protein